ncbi:MAG TPA: PRC and DUF2382 domain-containing protein [Verrucomicrobiae bacterium]|nr:PRC and DUF2382 domain-containing protein [Verrucomicrobiae bacterium]
MSATTSPDEGRYIGYAVIDKNSEKIGTVESVWLDGGGDPAYLAVRSGWLGMGRMHVVPAQSAQVSQRDRSIRVPYLVEDIKGAPEFDTAADLQTTDEDRIGGYYGRYGFKREGWLERQQKQTRNENPQRAQSSESARRVEGEQRVQLKEEQVKVGKREVEYGGVRLRKVVRTEVVNQPVELTREEIVIERVPAGQATQANASGTLNKEFTQEEIYVPLRREEAVVAKEARVTEEVRVGKRKERETRTVSETVRKEDVEIQENVPESRMNASGTRSKTEKYQPKERSKG